MEHLDELQLQAGEIVHYKGMPFYLKDAITILGRSENMEALDGVRVPRDAELLQRAEATEQRARDLEGWIARRGYRRCDIPACNCGMYHGGHAEDRLREISDELGELTNGYTILGAVKGLMQCAQGYRPLLKALAGLEVTDSELEHHQKYGNRPLFGKGNALITVGDVLEARRLLAQ